MPHQQLLPLVGHLIKPDAAIQEPTSGSDWAADFTNQLQLDHPGTHPSMPEMLSQQQQHQWALQQQQQQARPKSLSAAWNELFVHSAAASASSPPHQRHAAEGPGEPPHHWVLQYLGMLFVSTLVSPLNPIAPQFSHTSSLL